MGKLAELLSAVLNTNPRTPLQHCSFEAWAALQVVWEGRLASYYANQIRTHPDEVYGGGFKAALDAFQQHGLRKTLLFVKKTGHLPLDDVAQSETGLSAKEQIQAALQSHCKGGQ